MAKIVSADRGQLVTVVCCFCASDMYVPPVTIFPRKISHELCSEAPAGTLPLISDTGYMNTDLFMQWLQNFQNHPKTTKTNPVLFILDTTFPIAA